MKQLLPKHAYKRNAEIYKLLANPQRLEILNLLKLQPLSVEEIIKVVEARKANVSQHLSILRHAQVVIAERDGQNVTYRIADPRIVEPCQILYQLWSKES